MSIARNTSDFGEKELDSVRISPLSQVDFHFSLAPFDRDCSLCK